MSALLGVDSFQPCTTAHLSLEQHGEFGSQAADRRRVSSLKARHPLVVSYYLDSHGLK
jgi:hypothetical protein